MRRTTCAVVGAGPAGAMLALLLARQGIPTVLLEAHADFDRDFRGDSIHPAILEALDDYAVQDAVAAANILSEPLRAGHISIQDLATVQRRRDWPTRITQAIVGATQRLMVAGLARTRGPARAPAALRLLPRIPWLRDLPLAWVLRPAARACERRGRPWGRRTRRHRGTGEGATAMTIAVSPFHLASDPQPQLPRGRRALPARGGLSAGAPPRVRLAIRRGRGGRAAQEEDR